MRYALFRDIRQCMVVIPYATFRDDLSGPIFKGQEIPMRRSGLITTRCVKSQRRAFLTLDICPYVIIEDQAMFMVKRRITITQFIHQQTHIY